MHQKIWELEARYPGGETHYCIERAPWRIRRLRKRYRAKGCAVVVRCARRRGS